MGGDGFGPGSVVNRRVNSHIRELLPSTYADDADYTFGGRRVLGIDEIPGNADAGVCSLEAFVGQRGQFEIVEERAFDPEVETGWVCRNRIARTESENVGRLEPFEYAVKTEVIIGDRQRNDRTVVDWATLGEDQLYGGREAQAATLLSERIGNERSRATGSGNDRHHGSLARLGSLAAVVDNDRGISVEWSTVDDLLGPDSDTITASADVETIESDAAKKRAIQKGIDFLSEDLNEELAGYDDRDCDEYGSGPGWEERPPESWETLPDGMTPAEAREEMRRMAEEIADMKQDF